MTPQERGRLDAVLEQRGVKHVDWYIGHVNEDYEQIIGGNEMADQYLYGWYHYADGTDKEFRYPAGREADLKQDGKAVTVEVKDGGKWNKRKGTVNWGGGNFSVTPRR